MHCCPAAEGCVLAALCARSGGQAMQQICAGLAAGLCGKTERQLLLLLPWRPRDAALVLASATQMATAPRAVQHRGTGQPASLRRSRTQRGAAAIHIAVFPEDAALVATLCPYEELQPMAELPM